MSLNKLKYDDFGELIWKEPKPRPRQSKKFNYDALFKLLGDALI
jgi:hypothetical protein